jgi:hypothetical protein
MPKSLRTSTLCVLLSGTTATQAQDIEPRTYSNAPVGVNFLIAGYPYARVLDLWSMSRTLDATVPYTW